MRQGLLIVVCILATGHLHASTCDRPLYRGFDSRLEVTLVGILPPGTDSITGFEIVDDVAITSFSRRIIALSSDGQMAAVPVIDGILSMSVDGAGIVRIQTPKAILRLGDSGLSADPLAAAGIVMGSGGPSLMESRWHAGTATLSALSSGRMDRFPIVTLDHQVTAASWNDEGLAMIAGRRLLAWEHGGRDLVELSADEGLASARDVCLVGSRRALVASKRAVILVADGRWSPVAVMKARVRWNGRSAFLLDEVARQVWRIDGLAAIGEAAADAARARALVEIWRQDRSEERPILEAARLAGCEQVDVWIAENGR